MSNGIETKTLTPKKNILKLSAGQNLLVFLT